MIEVMSAIKEKLQTIGLEGEIDASDETREKYSHDASMFEITPEVVVHPKTTEDITKLVKFVSEGKASNPSLSLTARSAGTDMSGAAINDSIIVDFSTHLTKLIHIDENSATTQPGMFYRDFDAETIKIDRMLPPYPASRDLCTIGGMVSNNSGGEKSLQYGKTVDYVTEMKFVFADGIERVVKPLTKDQLLAKIGQDDFEGTVYKQLFELLEANYDTIQAARPTVSKDSTGYHLWNVWDRETGIFDLGRAIIGAQGTLGLVTEATLKIVERPKNSGLLVVFLNDIAGLGDLIATIVKHKPATFEGFDDATMKLSMKFMPSFLRILGPVRFIRLCFSLIPTGMQLLKGFPKLVLMVEFNGATSDEVRQKVNFLHAELSTQKSKFNISGFEKTPTEASSDKFWVMRRYSFQLLRSKVKDKHTAPFIDDFVVSPNHLPDFLPKIYEIIKKYDLLATVAGHMGDGNFHIIPLMTLENPKDRAKLEPAMKEVNALVLEFGGSLSGEHNDGLVRGPWLEAQYGKEMVDIFKRTKDIFDPSHIFNPNKKAYATWEYSFSHVRKDFNEPGK